MLDLLSTRPRTLARGVASTELMCDTERRRPVDMATTART